MSEKIQSNPQTKRARQALRKMRKVWRKARPGMRLRCIVDLFGMPLKVPEEGGIYTIRELRRGLYKTWALGFTLREIVNDVSDEMGSEPFFDAGCFELIASEDESHRPTP